MHIFINWPIECKVQIIAFKFTKNEHPCALILAQSSVIVKGCCQTAALTWRRPGAKTTQFKSVATPGFSKPSQFYTMKTRRLFTGWQIRHNGLRPLEVRTRSEHIMLIQCKVSAYDLSLKPSQCLCSFSSCPGSTWFAPMCNHLPLIRTTYLLTRNSEIQLYKLSHHTHVRTCAQSSLDWCKTLTNPAATYTVCMVCCHDKLTVCLVYIYIYL